MFNICLSIFLEQDPTVGRVVALDEAHKYMNTSSEATTFTETLLATIRLQRHLGVRVFISTQEPTISPKLLDLSSSIIVHRFTSPQWLQALKHHLAPVSSNSIKDDSDTDGENLDTVKGCLLSSQGTAQDIFESIVTLSVGEALLFCPSATIGIVIDKKEFSLERLGFSYIKAKIRNRLTEDGGRSILAP